MVFNKKQLARDTPSEPSAPPPCPQKDLFQRINFSYQASVFLQHHDLAPQSVPTRIDRKGKRKAIDEVREPFETPNLSGLARSCIKSTKRMAVHNQLKL